MKKISLVFISKALAPKITLLLFTFLTVHTASDSMIKAPSLETILGISKNSPLNTTTLLQPSHALLEHRKAYSFIWPIFIAAPLLLYVWLWRKYYEPINKIRNSSESEYLAFRGSANINNITFYRRTISEKIDAEAIKLLGFNPKITIETDQGNPSKEHGIFVTGYGWGSLSQDNELHQFWGKFAAVGKKANICFFDFADQKLEPISALINLNKILLTNFGTSLDVKTILFVFKTCVDEGYKKIYGFYHSRAGGAFLRALYAINHPEKYDDLFWKELGFKTKHNKVNYSKIKKVAKALKRGRTALAQPWFDPAATFEMRFNWCAGFIGKFLSFFTSYDQKAISALRALEEISNEMITDKKKRYPKLIITVAEDDQVIGNKHRDTLKKISSESLNKITIKNFNLVKFEETFPKACNSKEEYYDHYSAQLKDDKFKKENKLISIIEHNNDHNTCSFGACLLHNILGPRSS